VEKFNLIRDLYALLKGLIYIYIYREKLSTFISTSNVVLIDVTSSTFTNRPNLLIQLKKKKRDITFVRHLLWSCPPAVRPHPSIVCTWKQTQGPSSPPPFLSCPLGRPANARGASPLAYERTRLASPAERRPPTRAVPRRARVHAPRIARRAPSAGTCRPPSALRPVAIHWRPLAPGIADIDLHHQAYYPTASHRRPLVPQHPRHPHPSPTRFRTAPLASVSTTRHRRPLLI